MRELSAYLYGVEAGRFWQSADGTVGFRYNDSWIAGASEGAGHPVSVSLPLDNSAGKDAVGAFIAGLLPDSAKHREMLAVELGIDHDPSDFNLLSKIGRDCAGALTIIPAGEPVETVGKPSLEYLEEDQLALYLSTLPRRPLLIDEEGGVLLSLAGVNDKAAVVASRNRIALPKHGFPSTHIIKTDIPGLDDSLKVEHFCLRVAGACGQEVPRSDVLKAGTQTFLLIRRYDRHILAANDGPTLRRLHQEDFCQALGVKPSKKYERHGGPGWKDCFRLMTVTTDPVRARQTLLDRVILQYLIGNPDAHGKNYSLLYDRTGAVRLAPFYDLNNAEAFRLKFKAAKPIMAMSIGGNFDRSALTAEDWNQFAADCGLGPDFVSMRVEELSRLIIEKASEVRSSLEGTLADSDLLDIVVEDISSRARLWTPLESPPPRTQRRPT